MEITAHKPHTAGKLQNVPVADILAEYEKGKTIPDLAERLGVSHQAVYIHLLRNDPEAWKEQQAARALAELERWEHEIERAPDAFAVTRAREGLRAAQWKLERVLRRIYGQDPPPMQINVHIGAVDARIEALERELGLIAAAHSGNVVDAEAIEDAQVVDDADLAQDGET